MKKIFFLGSGGLFKEIFYWYKDQIKFESSQNEIIGVIDDDVSGQRFEEFSKLKRIKSKDLKNEKNIYLIVAMGLTEIRSKVINKFKKFKFENVIHPSASISGGANYGKGNVFCPNTIISGDAKIGNFNLFNFSSMVSHDCNIGNENVLSPGAALMGNVTIGNLNFFGVNSSMIPGTQLGNNNIIGAGAVLTKTFNNDHTIIGVPAREKKKLKIISLKTKNLKKSQILSICKLKDTYWPWTIKKQLEWFKKTPKKNDINNMLIINNKIVGYTLLRKRKAFENNKSFFYYYLDSMVLHPKFRKKGFGKVLMTFNNKILNDLKKHAFLTCTKETQPFYSKNDWKPLSINKFKIMDHKPAWFNEKLSLNGMTYNLKNDIKKKINYYLNK